MSFYKFFVAGFLVSFFVPVCFASFPDVSEEDANFTAINYVQEKGIVSGYLDGTFKPGKSINRAEFTKIIIGSSFWYKPEDDKATYDIYSLIGLDFFDVVSGEWYVPYVRKAVSEGVVSGYPDGSFKPADDINFVEAAKIIVEAFDYPVDSDDSGIWYKRYVDVLSDKKGIPVTVNSFDHKVTRGELAEMVYRLKNHVDSKFYNTYADLKEKSVSLDCSKYGESYESGNFKDFYFCYDSEWGGVSLHAGNLSFVGGNFDVKTLTESQSLFGVTPYISFISDDYRFHFSQLTLIFPYNIFVRIYELDPSMSADEVKKVLNIDFDAAVVTSVEVDGRKAFKISVDSDDYLFFDIPVNVVAYVVFDGDGNVCSISYISGDYADRLYDFMMSLRFGDADLLDTPYKDDNVIGNDYADVSLIVYTDFVCSFCAKFHDTVKYFLYQYDGKVNLVYRNFPLKFHDPEATNFANMLECVASIDGDSSYSKSVNDVFEGVFSFDELFVSGYAAGEMHNVDALNKCYDEKLFSDKVNRDISTGLDYGINATPTTIIRNNRTGEEVKVVGNVSEEKLKKVVDPMVRLFK